MKNKVLNFVLKAYPNVWFNLMVVVLSSVVGVISGSAGSGFAAIVPMLYLVGAAIYDQNKPKLVPAKPVAKKKTK